MRPTFYLQKVSKHGASNPVVARLSIQTADLIQWLAVSDGERKEILGLYLELQRRLLSCFDIRSRLLRARDEALEDAKHAWDKGQNTVPHIIGMQEEVEGFLFSAKIYLREVARLLNKLFEAELANDSAIFWSPKGGASVVATWATERFGADHGTTSMLASEASWVSEIVCFRNAVEHPGGKSGTLKLTNFEPHPEGIMPPTWARVGADERPQSDLFNDMTVMLDNLLTLAEDLLVDAIHARPVFPQIKIVQLAEDRRDRHAPVRFKATVDIGKFKPKL